MAATRRRPRPSVEELLFEEPYRFEFFQAVRLLHGLRPDREPVGEDAAPNDEVLRFQVEQSLGFPASEILDLETSEEGGGPLRMTERFMGLTGPKTVLPAHYTELIIGRATKKDHAFASFLDLFNHRMVSLFYRAWLKYRHYLEHDPDSKGSFAGYLFAFFGMGTRGLRGRLATPDPSLLFYAGLLGQRPHSVTALEGLLSDYFGAIPARIEQFVGQWLDLDPESLSSLGRIGKNNQLGVNTVVGSRVWDTQSRFRVRLGPLSWEQFGTFLPVGSASRALLDLTRFYVGQEYDFEFQLVLRASDAPAAQLGSQGPNAPRLGWSTWIFSKTPDKDPDDTILDADALRRYHEQGEEARAQ